MEAEFKSLRHSEISQGEAAAMMIALEERMKLLKYQETRYENFCESFKFNYIDL